MFLKLKFGGICVFRRRLEVIGLSKVNVILSMGIVCFFGVEVSLKFWFLSYRYGF